MATFRDILSSLLRRDKEIEAMPSKHEELVKTFGELLKAYAASTNIHDDFRRDVEMMIIAVLDLAETLLAPRYAIDEVIYDVAAAQASLTRMLEYAREARPRAKGFALATSDQLHILPGFFYKSKTEAEEMAATLRDAMKQPLLVIDAEVAGHHVIQPRRPLNVLAIAELAAPKPVEKTAWQEPTTSGSTPSPSTSENVKPVTAPTPTSAPPPLPPSSPPSVPASPTSPPIPPA